MFTEENQSGFIGKIKNIFAQPEGEQAGTKQHDTLVMGTRTVNASNTPNTRQDSNLSFEDWRKQLHVRTVEVSSPVVSTPKNIRDLDIAFASRFNEMGGRFLYCESLAEAVAAISDLKNEQQWHHVFCFENETKDAFAQAGFQKGAIGYTIENSDAAISLCESLIAESGTVIFNPKQASRRSLSCFPKTHIVLADTRRLCADLLEGLERFHVDHKGELPAVFDISKDQSAHFFDASRLILNAHGTRDVWVILIDEVIKPSNRL